jgi:hypothetical protein
MEGGEVVCRFYQYIVSEIAASGRWPVHTRELLSIYEAYRALHNQDRVPTFQKIFYQLINHLRLVRCTEGVLYWAYDLGAKDQLRGALAEPPARVYGQQPGSAPAVCNSCGVVFVESIGHQCKAPLADRLGGAGTSLRGPPVLGVENQERGVNASFKARWEGRLGPDVNILKCGLCGLTSRSKKDFQTHLDGKRHAANEEQAATRRAAQAIASHTPHPETARGASALSIPGGVLSRLGSRAFHAHCPLCDVTCQSQVTWKAHLMGRMHQQGLANSEAVNSASMDAEKASQTFCLICQVHVSAGGRNMEMHRRGRKHQEAVAALNGQGFTTAEFLNSAPDQAANLPRAARINQTPSNPIFKPILKPLPKPPEPTLVIVPGSTANHEKCTLCGVEVHERNMLSHVKGKRHEENVKRHEELEGQRAQEEPEEKFTCHVCMKDFPKLISLEQHKQSLKHQVRLQALEAANRIVPPGGKRKREEGGDWPVTAGALVGGATGEKRKRGEEEGAVFEANGWGGKEEGALSEANSWASLHAPPGKKWEHGNENGAHWEDGKIVSRTMVSASRDAPHGEKRKRKGGEEASPEAKSEPEWERKKRLRMERFGNGAVMHRQGSRGSSAEGSPGLGTDQPLNGQVSTDGGKCEKSSAPKFTIIKASSEAEISFPLVKKPAVGGAGREGKPGGGRQQGRSEMPGTDKERFTRGDKEGASAAEPGKVGGETLVGNATHRETGRGVNWGGVMTSAAKQGGVTSGTPSFLRKGEGWGFDKTRKRMNGNSSDGDKASGSLTVRVGGAANQEVQYTVLPYGDLDSPEVNARVLTELATQNGASDGAATGRVLGGGESRAQLNDGESDISKKRRQRESAVQPASAGGARDGAL